MIRSLAFPALSFSAVALSSAGQTSPGALPAEKLPRIVIESLLPVTLPFETWEGLLVVEAGIGSGRLQKAALHTGLAHTVVTATLAHNRGLKGGAAEPIATLYGPMRAETTRIPLLRVGTLPMADLPAGIGDLLRHHTGKTMPDAPEVWLGASTLQLAAFTLDPLAGTITFSKPGATFPKGANVVPFEVDQGRIVVQAKADGKSFKAVLDTATVSTLVPSETGKALAKGGAVSQPIRHPNGKEAVAGLLQIKELSIGKLTVKGVSALYLSSGDSGGMDPAIGAIGTDVMLRFRVTIDYASKRIAFEKPRIAPPAKGAVP